MQIRNSCKANDDVHGSFFLGTKHSFNNGFTLLELMVVLAIIGVMLAMLIPAVQSARESARRMRCQSNLKQAVLGLHNYHSAHDHLPMHGGGTRTEINPPLGSGGNELGNHFTLSFLVGLLPFIDQQGLLLVFKLSLPRDLDLAT
jgi:prepilin-type N-terminal cleavage/methylation domain-containing protein